MCRRWGSDSSRPARRRTPATGSEGGFRADEGPPSSIIAIFEFRERNYLFAVGNGVCQGGLGLLRQSLNMETSLNPGAFLNPTVLFFFLGLMARVVRSDFKVPESASKLVSYYLLMAIGLKGGQELAHTDSLSSAGPVLALAIGASVVVPLLVFRVAKWRLSTPDSAAVAATYGSVSAVTFVTAAEYLDQVEAPFGGYIVAAMALMEAPAIVVAIFLTRRSGQAVGEKTSTFGILRDACRSGSILVLIGSLVIGLVSPARELDALAPFTNDLFKGMLAFFLLDMGTVAAARWRDARAAGLFVVAMAVFVPIVSGVSMAFLSTALGIGTGDAYLLTILAASGSYIAVPAAMRTALPQANLGIFLPMSLAVTFPMNIVIGIPAYFALVQALAPA